MFRKMRRIKQLLPQEEAVSLLSEASNVVIAVIGDDGYPYTFAVSPVLCGNRLYFHSAREGHKIDAIRKEPKCSFFTVVQDDVISEEFTTYFKSVQGFGKAHIVEDREEFVKAFRLLSEKFSLAHMDMFDKQMDSSAANACVVAIDIEHMTGKEAIELVRKRIK